MITKHKLGDVAKELGVATKEIIELLRDVLGVEKKHMNSLDKDELDIVFEHFTQTNALESFDEYFAEREVSVPAPESLDEILAQYKIRAENKSSTATAKKTTRKLKERKFQNTFVVPIVKTKGETKFMSESETLENSGSKVVINTKIENMNIEKYNEKYDKIAAKTTSHRFSGVLNQKQKIHQKSQQNKKFAKKHESEAERLARIERERKAKPITVRIPDEITVYELALRLKVNSSQVIKKLIELGIMVSINDVIDFDTASLVAMDFHAKIEREAIKNIEEILIDGREDPPENLKTRAPVVVVMGHVDHGKTSLLDAIRNTGVTEHEHGGITQHIGAYKTFVDGNQITFIDTPGHEAFTTMRARGAKITDIAILVVAADDGVMPQTVEAINHAKDAEVSIIVAVNKIDKPGADPEKIKQQLTEYGIVAEEWGGDVPFVNVSARNSAGIKELLEMIAIVSEMKELKANPNRAGKGNVIESRLDKGKGPIATVLVRTGMLKPGDVVVAGSALGRVRSMISENGCCVTVAYPSDPVEITGLDSVPECGDEFNVVCDEKLARRLVEQRAVAKENERLGLERKVTLENLFERMKSGSVRELKVIIKGDVQGSAEAVRQSLEKINISDNDGEIKVRVIHDAVGAVNESDVMLANISGAIIIGFNVRPIADASELARANGTEIKLYRVIYDCVNEIENAMRGMLAQKFHEVELGFAECRKVYKISKVGTIAGCYVASGNILRSSNVRVMRDGIVIAEDIIDSLQRSKNSVKEVPQGYECGIKLAKFSDVKESDILQSFIMEEIK
jgi:translation initiation factor IF-2